MSIPCLPKIKNYDIECSWCRINGEKKKLLGCTICHSFICKSCANKHRICGNCKKKPLPSINILSSDSRIRNAFQE